MILTQNWDYRGVLTYSPWYMYETLEANRELKGSGEKTTRDLQNKMCMCLNQYRFLGSLYKLCLLHLLLNVHLQRNVHPFLHDKAFTVKVRICFTTTKGKLYLFIQLCDQWVRTYMNYFIRSKDLQLMNRIFLIMKNLRSFYSSSET